MFTVSVLLFVASMAQAPQPGSSSSARPSSTAPAEQITLPVDLAKIQKAVSRPAAIRHDTERRVFRVEVFARKPTIEDILGRDYLIGPVPYGGMTHSEFLSMVTPEQYRGMSAFTNGEAITVAATSFALNWAVMKAVDKLKAAKTARDKEAARREVIDAMNELEEARKKAGLPPK